MIFPFCQVIAIAMQGDVFYAGVKRGLKRQRCMAWGRQDFRI
ncbi:MAG: hypothetical protein AB3N13_10975 [Arenibacterium sp.]